VIEKFTDIDFHPEVHDGLDAMGFNEPTPIQAQAIPVIMEGKDLIACAQTGTGKTAAYLLPVLNAILEKDHPGVDTLILAPTRELALQIDQQIEGFAYYTNSSSIAVYGGSDGIVFEREKKALTEGADIVIATPGRLLSHLNLGYVKVDTLRHLILDEADRMLDMGFYEDLLRIISFLPKTRQTLLFSATMPPRIRELANKILIEPEQISIAISKPAEGIVQAAYLVYDNQKTQLVKELVQGKGKDLESVIIFSSTKSNVKVIEKELQKLGLAARAIHSDLEQAEREEVMREFRNRKTQVLVATDIVSRGIDIEGISLVINYDVPHDAEDYIHRIGRTARADATGVALTFINDKDQHYFARIEAMIEKEVHKIPLPPHLGTGPEYNPKRKSSGGHSGGDRKKGGKRFFKPRPKKKN
jgi:superfamily II DNA/RNA helicase